MRTTVRPASLLLTGVLVFAACTGAAASPSPSPTTAPTPADTPPATASPTPDACARENLETVTAGTLTIGADNPAFPPYFQPTEGGNTEPWELGDPTNGQGLEGATAYAIAEELGFSRDEVAWSPVPFNNAIAPGPKDFDLYLSQVSFSEERAQAVDLSAGYFDLNQSVVALASDPIANVTTVAGLKDFVLGAPVGTTSLTYITTTIQPTREPMVYDTLDAALQALQAEQVDGIVVDLPTAFYMTAVQLEDGKIVGSLPTVGATEHFSVVLDKDSPLTECVDSALGAIRTAGAIDAIRDQWITGQGAPELTR